MHDLPHPIDQMPAIPPMTLRHSLESVNTAEYNAIMAITWLPAPHIPAAALLFGYLLGDVLMFCAIMSGPFIIDSWLINF